MKSIHAMIHRLHNPDLGILFVRLALGIVFIHAGWLKIANPEMPAAFFAAIDIPAALAYLVMWVEFLGGIALVLGILVRYVGILLAIIMLTAISKVHFVNGYGLQNNGYEYTLALLLMALGVVTLGAGSYSLARLFRK